MIFLEFLNQALDINSEINFKREQLESLRTIAARCTSTPGGTPCSRQDARGRLDA